MNRICDKCGEEMTETASVCETCGNNTVVSDISPKTAPGIGPGIDDISISYVLTVHFAQGVQECFLPSVQNRTVSIELDRELSGTGSEVTLTLDVFDDIWTIYPNDHVSFQKPQVLSDDLRIDARMALTGAEIVILVDELDVRQTQFTKFYVESNTRISMGAGEHNNLCYDKNRMVSGKDPGKHHLVIETTYAELVDDSMNGTYINGKRVSGRQKLCYGDTIYVLGLKLIWLGNVIAINRSRSKCKVTGLRPVGMQNDINHINEPPSDDEYYSRSPRRMPKTDTETVELDAPPGPGSRRRQPLWMTIGPSLSMVLPMGIGILFTMMATRSTGAAASPFMFMGIFTSVTAAFVGVFWALMSVRYQKKQEKEGEENRQKRYSEYLDRMEKIIIDKHNDNRFSMNTGYPHTDECMNWIATLNRRLWERNVNHPDFLTVRLGMGAIPSPNPIAVPKERFSLISDDLAERPFDIKKRYETLPNVPILLSLLENKLIGVIGKERHDVLGAARILATELAVMHSYTDVKMVFIVPKNEDWEFAKWLPHVWSEDNSIRLIANNANSVGEVLFHLSGVIRTRSDEDRQDSGNIPHYVVFIGDPGLVEHEAVIKLISDSSQELGFSTLLFYDRLEKLPNNCTVIVQPDKEYSGFYSLENAFNSLSGVNFDIVSPFRLNEMSRLLSDIKVKEAEGMGAIPQMLSFLDMYKTGDVKGIDIYRNWLENRTYESMKALIGARGGGVPVYLDIHEKYHGPHGLVAGTTGSGKSEMLQTYILSLAVSYHPYEVSFILIDYKGGGMAESFRGLTHVAGIITNLGGNQTNRALASIRSEMKRRQAVFNEYKIKHIDDYIELFRAGKAGEPIPHLLLIADEFAELKKEQPDFVRELVSASRIGRTLGVHLILATQKPDGVVDEQIWSNTRFRVCLRVAEKSDSMGMLKHPEAAYITQAGRGYFQVGSDEIFEEFQSGWSGALYEPDIPYTDEKAGEVKMINLWGRPSVLSSGKQKETSESKVIQIDAITTYIQEIAERHGIKPVSNVWLPPLPKVVYLDELPYLKLDSRELSVPVGLLDDPVSQEQRAVAVNFTQNNHILVASSVSGGKTTFMQTVLYGLVTTKTPEQLNIYIADYSSRTLAVFSGLPHVGGVVYDDDLDRSGKLVALLMKELGRRKLLFSSRGIGSFKEYSRLYNDVPAIIFAIDNLPGFIEINEKHEENMLQLALGAASYGIYLFGTCTNFSDLRSKLRQNMRFGVGLQLPEKYDYDEVLGNRGEITAEDGCPGRGLIKVESDDNKDPRSLEFQTAICVRTNEETLLNTELASTFSQITEAWKGTVAVKIPQVPYDMTFDSFKTYREVKQAMADGSMPVGYDIKEATPVCLKTDDLFCYVISGGARTGKTNMIKLLALQSAAMGYDVIMLDNDLSQLSVWANEHGITCLTNKDKLYDWLTQMIPEFSRRHKKIEDAGGRKFSKAAMKDEKQIVLLIHDFGAFLSDIYSDTRNMYSFFENMVKLGNDHKVAIFACITREDSSLHSGRLVYMGFTSWKEGLHLGGQTDNQRIFEFDIPPSERIKKLPAGYGHTYENENTKTIVTPEV